MVALTNWALQKGGLFPEVEGEPGEDYVLETESLLEEARAHSSFSLSHFYGTSASAWHHFPHFHSSGTHSTTPAPTPQDMPVSASSSSHALASYRPERAETPRRKLARPLLSGCFQTLAQIFTWLGPWLHSAFCSNVTSTVRGFLDPFYLTQHPCLSLSPYPALSFLYGTSLPPAVYLSVLFLLHWAVTLQGLYYI